MNVQSINELIAEGRLDSLVLVDVRIPVEYQACHAKGALNIPLDEFSADNIESLKIRGTIGLLCQGGTRAKPLAKN
jgi:rhodanese-related sulfurtransferase